MLIVYWLVSVIIFRVGEIVDLLNGQYSPADNWTFLVDMLSMFIGCYGLTASIEILARPPHNIHSAPRYSRAAFLIWSVSAVLKFVLILIDVEVAFYVETHLVLIPFHLFYLPRGIWRCLNDFVDEVYEEMGRCADASRIPDSPNSSNSSREMENV